MHWFENCEYFFLFSESKNHCIVRIKGKKRKMRKNEITNEGWSIVWMYAVYNVVNHIYMIHEYHICRFLWLYDKQTRAKHTLRLLVHHVIVFSHKPSAIYLHRWNEINWRKQQNLCRDDRIHWKTKKNLHIIFIPHIIMYLTSTIDSIQIKYFFYNIIFDFIYNLFFSGLHRNE